MGLFEIPLESDEGEETVLQSFSVESSTCRDFWDQLMEGWVRVSTPDGAGCSRPPKPPC